MKFSVLLPTRNRLEYLRYAVETVRRQDYDDWEIIISDNCSEDDIAGYVRSLEEPRVKYYRTQSFVPVTENWNNALERSTGDYVIMLGDDDCLMRGYFSTIRRLVEQFDAPDFIYTSAFLYTYPGVDPHAAEGSLLPYGYASFLNTGAGEPYLLDRAQAHELVRGFVDFRVLYGFNMQFFVISRRLIDSLADKGPFFQSPFPDYYASNAMFLRAERILVCPYPLVTIGVTPKSYGFYHANKREAEGVEFLKSLPDPQAARRLERVLLPGTNINTSWLFSAEKLKANYGAEFPLSVTYRRYRYLQITYVYEQVYLQKSLTKDDLR
ncbi:MAG TPA: glycosyltransferase, partial [Pyrinomonadaceae bacterium]